MPAMRGPLSREPSPAWTPAEPQCLPGETSCFLHHPPDHQVWFVAVTRGSSSYLDEHASFFRQQLKLFICTSVQINTYVWKLNAEGVLCPMQPGYNSNCSLDRAAKLFLLISQKVLNLQGQTLSLLMSLMDQNPNLHQLQSDPCAVTGPVELLQPSLPRQPSCCAACSGAEDLAMGWR